MTTHHTSGAADLPEAQRQKFEAWLPKSWSRETFVDDEDGDTMYVDDWVQGAFVGFCAALAAGQAVAPAEPTREFLERTLAAMEGVIDVADRKTAEFDALRSCVIDLTLMLFKPATRPAPPAMDGGEGARKPLTEEQVALAFRRGIGQWMTPGTAFAAGVRSAELAHGIAARAAQKEGE